LGKCLIDTNKALTSNPEPCVWIICCCLDVYMFVMRETNSQVKCPSKLKIGAKSKKYPHVKVEGKHGNVLVAKKKILVKPTSSPEMDVAHTENSHVIGKWDGNIKKVMEITSCLIHFPDYNRHNVSISGPVQGVEAARKRIRDLQPLVLTFDLPVTLVPKALLDAVSPVIQQVAQALGISVSFRAQPRQQLWSEDCRAKAVCVLMELMLRGRGWGSWRSHEGGHHPAGSSAVMHQTQTQTVLPEVSAPQNPPSLLIQGSPDRVCLARQQLMDCLPVCLMFDMHEDREVDPRKLAQIIQSLGVFVSIKPKVKQTANSVVVDGLERNISKLYEARRLLLGLHSSEVAMTTKMNSDPMLVSNGLTNYWLNMLLQQLRLTNPGSVPAPESLIGALSQTKPHPSPPPGLTLPSEGMRMGLKGTESRQLEKVWRDYHQITESIPVGLLTTKISSVLFPSRTHQSQNNLTAFPPLFTSFIPLFILSQDYDYEIKKLLATKAMHRKSVVTEVRTPTDTWSGLGFSKSIPASAVKELRNINQGPSELEGKSVERHDRQGSSSSSPSPSSSFSSSPSNFSSSFSTSSFPGMSTVMALTGSQRSPSPQPTDDLPELLSQLGLGKYIDVFQQQEIDFQTFLTLRTMLLAVSDLNKNKRKRSETPAGKPGYLEGGASGQLTQIMDEDTAAQSNHW
uniref:Bicaudal C homolog 2 n=1 Tax=Hucho hucho TaxID=62062 RepID=A0A4W5JZD4_9TELE